MDNITELHPALNPDTVLEEAKGKYMKVVVIGVDSDGEMEIAASLNLSEYDIVFALDRSKYVMHTMMD